MCKTEGNSFNIYFNTNILVSKDVLVVTVTGDEAIHRRKNCRSPAKKENPGMANDTSKVLFSFKFVTSRFLCFYFQLLNHFYVFHGAHYPWKSWKTPENLNISSRALEKFWKY